MRISALVIFAAMYSGCVCSDADPGGTGGGGGEGGGSGGGGDFDPLDAGIHFQCASLNAFEADEIGVLATALVPPFPDGTSEQGLDDAGCWRVKRVASGGELTSFEVRRLSGEFDFKIEGSTVTIFEKADKIAAKWDGTTLSTDSDLDGFAESELKETSSVSGLTELKTTTYSASTHAVTRRVTFTPSTTALMMHNKEEVLVSGSLEVREWDSPALQKQLGPPTCVFVDLDQEVPCPDPDAIKKQIDDAILEGAKCMQGMGNPLGEDFVKLMIVRNQIAKKGDIHCSRQSKNTGQYAAAVDTSKPSGRIPFYVNAELATCGANYSKSSLFHEAIHLIEGGHDDKLLDDAFNNGMLLESEYTYFDRMRSCEAMCFGTKLKTKCACAKCLKTKVCDDRCSSMGSCLERQMKPDGGTVAVMSEAVGAVCTSGMGSLHKTMAACSGACAGGAASCKSKSLSCDPSCQ